VIEMQIRNQSRKVFSYFLSPMSIGILIGVISLGTFSAANWIYYNLIHPATIVRSPGTIVAKGTDKDIEPPNRFFDVKSQTDLSNDYFYVSDKLWDSQKVGTRICISKSTRKAVNDDGVVSHYGNIRLLLGDCQ
jgi:hypothetical protein